MVSAQKHRRWQPDVCRGLPGKYTAAGQRGRPSVELATVWLGHARTADTARDSALNQNSEVMGEAASDPIAHATVGGNPMARRMALKPSVRWSL